MFITTFKKNYLMQIVLLIITPIILWLPAFIHPPQVLINSSLDMPLYEGLASFMKDYCFFSTLIAFVLVILQAFYINHILTFYQLTKKTSFFPAFIYILLMSCDYRVMTLSSILIANCFGIIALKFFLNCYNKNEGLDEIFVSTFLLAISTLFYAPCIFFILWIWFGLFNYKIYKWRSFFVSIFGFITPFIVLCVYYYLADNLAILETFFQKHFLIIPPYDKFLIQPIQIVYMAYLIILVVPSFFITFNYRNDKKLSVRKRTSTIILLFAISILPFVYNVDIETMSLIFAPTLAFLLTVFFFSIKRTIYADLFFIIFILLTITKILLNYKFIV
jgi:hypothetical protein